MRAATLAFLAMAAACGGGGARPTDGNAANVDGGTTSDSSIAWDVSLGDIAPIQPQSCSSAWRVVYTSEPEELVPGREDLAWRDGTLFVGHSSTAYSWVFSLPDHGGAKNLLYEGRFRNFWLEDDRVLYAQGKDLFTMPQAGGPPQLLLRYGGTFTGLPSDEGYNRNLDRTAIYWQHYAQGLKVFRHLRNGGDDVIIATLPEEETRARSQSWMRQAKGHLLFSFPGEVRESLVFTVSKVTGERKILPELGSSSKLLTASKDGVLLWSRREQGPADRQGRSQTYYVLARSDVDGAPPVFFATDMSPIAIPLQAWSAGSGAWYISTTEVDRGGARHLSIWFVAADGSARRLACQAQPPAQSPSDYNRDDLTITAAVPADGAFYVSLADPRGGWTVVGVDNPGASTDTGDIGSAQGAPGTGGDAGLPDAGYTCPNPDGGASSDAGVAPNSITEFPVPSPKSAPNIIIAGPDGNLYFAEVQTGKLARITTGGCVTEFPLQHGAADLTLGPDGHLWFPMPAIDRIGRIEVDGTLPRQFVLARLSSRPQGITTGSDGNLWISQLSPSAMVRMTPTGTATQFLTPTQFAEPIESTPGPPGTVWFSERQARRIGRVDVATGAITEFPVPNGGTPGEMTTGPDGNLWFLAYQSGRALVTQLNATGTFTEFMLPTGAGPTSITTGPDGNLWITEDTANKIARFSPSTGAIVEFPIPTPAAGARSITVGPDKNLWFVEISANQIARMIP